MILSVATYRGPSLQFIQQCQALVRCGVVSRLIFTEGISCVTLARNIQISRALAACKGGEPVLLADDDMVFDDCTVRQIARESAESSRPVAARYVDNGGKPCWGEREVAPDHSVTVAGLGLMVIPYLSLVALKETMPQFEHPSVSKEIFVCFTECGVVSGQWWSEDHLLCYRLGNVQVSRAVAGHNKTKTLYPDPGDL